MNAFKLAFSRFGGWYTLLGAGSLLACWWIAGPKAVLNSLTEDARLLVSLLPLYAGALLIGGFAQVVLPLAPAGPFVSFPIIVALFKAGADIGALVAFLTA